MFNLTNFDGIFQTMQATKRNAGVPSAMVARQSLKDEELVSRIKKNKVYR